jgi:hypothetical protein
MKTLLQKLKKDHGKNLFCLSDFPYSFLNFAMTFTLGENWEELFDFTVCDYKGPLFYRAETTFKAKDGSEVKKLT